MGLLLCGSSSDKAQEMLVRGAGRPEGVLQGPALGS
jgi:hypothetical protein